MVYLNSGEMEKEENRRKQGGRDNLEETNLLNMLELNEDEDGAGEKKLFVRFIYT